MVTKAKTRSICAKHKAIPKHIKNLKGGEKQK